MQSTGRSAVIVGIVIIAGLIILMFLSLRINEDLAGDNTYKLYGHFIKANGLEKGNPIAVAGVSIGKVTSISYNTKAGKVEVEMAIYEANSIPQNSLATIRTKSLLGSYYIDFSVSDLSDGFFDDGDIVQTKDVATLDDLMDSMSQLSEGAGGLIASLNA